MIVDTSVIVAILLKERGYEELSLKIAKTSSQLSVVSYVEASMVLVGRRGNQIVDELNELLIELQVNSAPVSSEQARVAVNAFCKYGKGRHPAGLNFGDCFSYALAKSVGEPLLFKGTDFSRTDVDVA